jgi:hypothetical protein
MYSKIKYLRCKIWFIVFLPDSSELQNCKTAELLRHSSLVTTSEQAQSSKAHLLKMLCSSARRGYPLTGQLNWLL